MAKTARTEETNAPARARPTPNPETVGAMAGKRGSESMDVRLTRALGKVRVVLGVGLPNLAFCAAFGLASWLLSRVLVTVLR